MSGEPRRILPGARSRWYVIFMKSATDRSSSTLVGEAPPGLAPQSIAAVKDFTARKTLEQAHAFARGLADVLRDARACVEQARALGCDLPAPFQTMSFLALSVIPSLKITDRGLVDVDRFELVPLDASQPA